MSATPHTERTPPPFVDDHGERAPDGLRKAGRSVSVLAFGELVNKATRFVAAILLARTLTLDDFGLVNVGIAISGILFALTALGMPEFGARKVAVHPDATRRVVGLVVVIRLAALIVASAVAIAAAAGLAPSRISLVALAALMAAGFAGSLDWLLRGRERMLDAAGAVALGGIVVVVGCGSLVMLHPTVAMALTVFASGEAIAALATWWRARPGRPKTPSPGEVVSTLRLAWPLGASGLIIYASYANLDTVLLAAVRSDAEAGVYSAPYRVFLAVGLLSVFASYALLPMLARAHHEGHSADGRELLVRAFVPLAGCGALLLAVAEIAGGQLITALFGPAYASTNTILVILCLGLPWNAIGLPSGYGLIGARRNADFLRGAAVAGALTLVLMAALIPSYGAEGAAIATTVGLIGSAIVWMRLARVLRPARSIVGSVALISLGGALAAAAPALSVPLGSATAVAGIAMLAAPALRYQVRAHR